MTLPQAPSQVLAQSPSLRERAVAAIRASIITGEAEPGEIYSVRQFADRLGVSATPIREALLDLAGDGLVEAVRNRGFRVLTPSEQDLDEIYRLRLMIEVPALALAADNMTPEIEASCREHARQTTEYARKGDLTGFLDVDRTFHLEILRCTNNRRLVDIVRRLRDETRLVGLPGLRGTDALVGSALEHVAIVDALSRGDGTTASIMMRRHIDHTRGIWAGQPEGDKRG
jgi:DNA-binding GntR family transcriptional regulator